MKNLLILLLFLIAAQAVATTPDRKARAAILLACKSKKASIFINGHWDEAKAIERDLGIPMATTLAHWLVESRMGRKPINLVEEILFLPILVETFSPRYKKRLSKIAKKFKFELLSLKRV